MSQQHREQFGFAIDETLDKRLPQDGYGRELFVAMRDKVFELAMDLAINRLKWAAG